MKGGTFVRLLWLEGEGEERERLLEDWEELRLVSTMVLGCGVGEGGVHPFVVVCVCWWCCSVCCVCFCDPRRIGEKREKWDYDFVVVVVVVVGEKND